MPDAVDSAARSGSRAWWPGPAAAVVTTALLVALAVDAAPVDATRRTSGGAAPPPPGTVGSNPWLERRVLNVAHQGGAREAPSNTLFALKTAVAAGADMLEIDVHATADGRVVAIHDTTVDRTTNRSGRVDAQTLAELKRLDAAYWFVPGCGACHDRPPDDYVLRGYATGRRTIPTGLHRRYGLDQPLTPNDFAIPTLGEILASFPDTLITLEIKRTAPDTTPYEQDVARLLRAFGRSDDVIVVSFSDLAIEKFKLHAPEVHTAPAAGQTAAFSASSRGAAPGAPNPRYRALQVPITVEGVRVVTRDFVADAHANGLAVHVWTVNDPAVMRRLVAIGVDGIMTDRPTVLEQVLAAEGVRFTPTSARPWSHSHDDQHEQVHNRVRP